MSGAGKYPHFKGIISPANLFFLDQWKIAQAVVGILHKLLLFCICDLVFFSIKTGIPFILYSGQKSKDICLLNRDFFEDLSRGFSPKMLNRDIF